MCTYCTTTNYRKIYENHNGIIPKDSDGRTYEIHHIDGNHSNNNPSNLKAVTIQEHYDIHYAQGDFGACMLIGNKMKLSPTEISTMATLHNHQMVQNGTHPFLGGKVQSKNAQQMVQNGTHPFLGGKIQSKSNKNRISNGTHNLLGENNPSRIASKNGTHHMSREDNLNKRRVEAGEHNFQTLRICPYCDKSGKGEVMFRWHFDKCKQKK